MSTRIDFEKFMFVVKALQVSETFYSSGFSSSSLSLSSSSSEANQGFEVIGPSFVESREVKGQTVG